MWRPFLFQVFSFELRAVWWNNGAEQLIPVHSPCAPWLYKSLSCTSLRSLFSRLSSLSFCQMTSVILLWTLSLQNFLVFFFFKVSPPKPPALCDQGDQGICIAYSDLSLVLFLFLIISGNDLCAGLLLSWCFRLSVYLGPGSLLWSGKGHGRAHHFTWRARAARLHGHRSPFTRVGLLSVWGLSVVLHPYNHIVMSAALSTHWLLRFLGR